MMINSPISWVWRNYYWSSPAGGCQNFPSRHAKGSRITAEYQTGNRRAAWWSGPRTEILGAVAEAGQTKKHMVGLPRVSTSLSDIMRTDDAVPVDFLKREAGRISAAPWVSFFARCHVYVSSQYQIFCISWPCGLENCDMQPLQPHHARAGCLMTE